MKTKFKPSLYFLANTSEEVLAKKKEDLRKIKIAVNDCLKVRRSRSRSIDR